MNLSRYAIAGPELAGQRHMTHGTIVAGRCYRFEGDAPRTADWTEPTAEEVQKAFPDIQLIAPEKPKLESPKFDGKKHPPKPSQE
jgi:hypothetical protein